MSYAIRPFSLRFSVYIRLIWRRFWISYFLVLSLRLENRFWSFHRRPFTMTWWPSDFLLTFSWPSFGCHKNYFIISPFSKKKDANPALSAFIFISFFCWCALLTSHGLEVGCHGKCLIMSLFSLDNPAFDVVWHFHHVPLKLLSEM